MLHSSCGAEISHRMAMASANCEGHQQMEVHSRIKRKNNACKPSSVLLIAQKPLSFVYATYPPGPDGPSFGAKGKK